MGKTKKKKMKCFIYTRVSTKMQTEGYSLEAQEQKLRQYAKYRDMEVIEPIFKDEGKSGKNIKGRPDFTRMMAEIKDGADVDYVLVFKLSRFGRNAADVLNSVQTLQDYGVELACTDDGIDTAQGSGKLMVAVLAAVAEIDRENIRAQTLAGREQKAKSGGWNGGFAPYGYKLVKENNEKAGKLFIDEEEAETIRQIYYLYTRQAMSMRAIADYLNTHGFVKRVRQNGRRDSFSPAFVKTVLDNPVYMGKIAYGRRRVEKKNDGERNETHVVKQKEYCLYEGIHEAIISEELWNEAHKKRLRTGHKSERVYNSDHVHLLSGLLKCPVCGGSMYGNPNRKKRPDGKGRYKEYFFYQCKHRQMVNGKKCTYNRQWNEEQVDKEVLEVVSRVINEDMLTGKLYDWFGFGVDDEKMREQIDVLSTSIDNAKKHIRNLGTRQDELSFSDKYYAEKFDELQRRIDELYASIENLEAERTNLEMMLGEASHKEYKQLTKKKKNGEEYIEAYKALLPHIKAEPRDRDFLRSIIDRIEIFEERQSDGFDREYTENEIEVMKEYDEKPAKGRLIKSIKFKVPIDLDNNVLEEIKRLGWEAGSWDKEGHVETVVLMSRKDT